MSRWSFRPPGPALTDILYRVDHVLARFAGQTQNQVDHDADAAVPEGFDGRVVYGQVVTAVDQVSGALMDGLQAQFHPEKVFLVDLREQVEDLAGQTVRAGGDGDAADQRMPQGSFVLCPKHLCWSVGVGMVLKIGQILGVRPLLRKKADLVLDGGREVSAAPFRAEQASAGALVPSLFGQVKPPSIDSLTVFWPKTFFK